jgi:hypothetical protein
MSDKDPVELAYESMISKFGLYETKTAGFITKLSDCNSIERKHVIDALVFDYKAECNYYLVHLNSMTTLEVEAFVWFVVMKLDLIRGLIPGAQAAPTPELNELLEDFENEMWQKINSLLLSEKNST